MSSDEGRRGGVVIEWRNPAAWTNGRQARRTLQGAAARKDAKSSINSETLQTARSRAFSANKKTTRVSGAVSKQTSGMCVELRMLLTVLCPMYSSKENSTDVLSCAEGGEGGRESRHEFSGHARESRWWKK